MIKIQNCLSVYALDLEIYGIFPAQKVSFGGDRLNLQQFFRAREVIELVTAGAGYHGNWTRLNGHIKMLWRISVSKKLRKELG